VSLLPPEITTNRQEQIMKFSFVLIAVPAAMFSLSSAVALAAEEKPETPTTGASAAAKVKPHSHVEAKGLGPVRVAEAAKGKPAKPLHDHRKEHK